MVYNQYDLPHAQLFDATVFISSEWAHYYDDNYRDNDYSVAIAMHHRHGGISC